MLKKLFYTFILLSSIIRVFGQDNNNDRLVQFSGLILTSDSIQPIPYVHISIMGSNLGTISDLNGFFSIVAKKKDTIRFSSIGFKSSKFVIPDTLKNQKYSMIKLMSIDTFYFDEAIISPLPGRNLFDYYFVKADIPDDDLERARKNLERELMKDRIEAMGMDGKENQRYYTNQYVQKFYYAGQIPPMNIFNPIAWAKFFEAWKRGDFKKSENKTYKNSDD